MYYIHLAMGKKSNEMQRTKNMLDTNQISSHQLTHHITSRALISSSSEEFTHKLDKQKRPITFENSHSFHKTDFESETVRPPIATQNIKEVK